MGPLGGDGEAVGGLWVGVAEFDEAVNGEAGFLEQGEPFADHQMEFDSSWVDVDVGPIRSTDFEGRAVQCVIGVLA